MRNDARVLILYGSRYGQTAKIAQRLAGMLRDCGHVVTVIDAAHPPRDLTLDDVDGIVVGSSILFGRYASAVRKFVRQHIGTLNSKPSGFFSVSGAEASPIESARWTARRTLDQFLRATGWHPTHTASLAGAYMFSRYPFPLRWVMRRIAEHNETAGADHEYTDWHQVAQFAERVAEAVDEHDRTHPRPAIATAP
jgi:menaquinone-dependent protoporphyrinogen oxidase